MKWFIQSALIFSLAVAAAAADADFYDWVQPGQPRYELLKKAASQAGASGWSADALRQGKPLPQASARMLAASLQDAPELSSELKKNLELAYVSEADSLSLSVQGIKSDTADLKQQLDALGLKVDQLSTAKSKNNYSPLTEPNARITVSTYLNSSAYYDSNNSNVWTRQNTVVGPGPLASSITLLMGGNLGETSTWSMNVATFIVQQDNAANAVSLYPFVAPNRNQNWGPYLGTNDFLSPRQYSTFNEEGFVGDAGNNLKLHLDLDGFSNLNLTFGIGALPIDPLIFSVYAVQGPGDVEFIPSGVGWKGLYLQKAGSNGWWIFDQAQMVLAPAWLQGQGDLNRFVLRLDLQGFDLLLLQDTGFYSTYSVSNTESNLSTDSWQFGQPYVSDHDYSFGMQGRLSTGGVLKAEWASANFYSRGPQPYSSPALVTQDLNWQDQAWSATLNQAFGYLNLVLQGSQIGPHYTVGRREGLYGQGLNSISRPNANYLDSTVDDPRSLSKTAWQTLDYDSTSFSNNTSRVDLQTTLNNDWVTFTLGGGFASQMEPSGPWITTTRAMNNNSQDGYSWEAVFAMGNGGASPGFPGAVIGQVPVTLPGQAITASPQATNATVAFNQPTTGVALYKGVPIKYLYNGKNASGGRWNWHDIQAPIPFDTYETIVLSQNGVGDHNLRDDSIKTVNALRTGLAFDAQSFFHMQFPSSINTTFEIRDVNEAVQVAGFGKNNLLEQTVSRISLEHGFSKNLTLVGGAGYENWRSMASAYPVSDGDTTWGLGFNMRLSRWISGMTVKARYNWLMHQDYEFSVRDFNGWNLSIGTRVEY